MTTLLMSDVTEEAADKGEENEFKRVKYTEIEPGSIGRPRRFVGTSLS